MKSDAGVVRRILTSRNRRRQKNRVRIVPVGWRGCWSAASGKLVDGGSGASQVECRLSAAECGRPGRIFEFPEGQRMVGGSGYMEPSDDHRL